MEGICSVSQVTYLTIVKGKNGMLMILNTPMRAKEVLVSFGLGGCKFGANAVT